MSASDSSPHVDPCVEHTNLAALAQVDPDLAGRIENLPADLVVEPAVTRDGRSSFRIASVDGRSTWFGRTSIPTIRAAALIEQFDAGQGNVLLPGVGEGSEVTLLLSQLGRHRAVFVWEPDAGNVSLALRLHDWSVAIALGRLVLLICPFENLAGRLTEWLDHHPGYLCPDRILMWPWASLAGLGGLRSAIQASYEELDRRRASAIEQVMGQASPADHAVQSAGTAGRLSLDTGLAILSLAPREDLWMLADGLAQASRGSNCPAAAVDVRSPADRHPLARVKRLRDDLPDGAGWALLLDAARKDLGKVLPGFVPAISWLGPNAAIDATLMGRTGPRDLIAVTNQRLADRLMNGGFDANRIVVCPRPCLVEGDASMAPAAAPTEVTIIADLASVRAEALGLTLGTHVRVWDAAIELLGGRIDTFTGQHAGAILAEAESRLKLPITDAGVREAICTALSGPAANTLLWQAISQHLVKQDISISIWGRGWPGFLAAHWRGEAASLAERRRILGRSAVVLAADVTGDVSLTTLLAAGGGAVVVARAHPGDRAPGGLAGLLELGREMLVFRRLSELPSLIISLLRDPHRRQILASGAIARCRAEHSPAARLETLRTAASSAFRSRPGLP